MSKISINGISLDPTQYKRELESLSLSSNDASISNYILIQVKGPLSKNNRKDLEKHRLDILEFVPKNTYIAYFKGDNISKIRALPFVTWANRYLKGFKIAPQLLESQQVAPVELMLLSENNVMIGDGARIVDIVFHVKADIGKAAKLVAAAAGLDPSTLKVSSNKIRATVDLSRLSAVASIDEVRHVEEVFESTLNNDVAIAILQADAVHRANPGLKGRGQIVAVCDTGFDKGSASDVHSAFAGRVNKLYDLGRPGKANDPHGHGTHVAGSVLGDGTAHDYGPVTGAAPNAELVLQSVLDPGGGLGGLPDDLNDLFYSPHQNNSAKVHTNSWGSRGSSGRYTTYSREVDEYVWYNRDLVVCFAAGNPGRDSDENGVIDLKSVQAPGTAKNCITVGASESNRPDQSRPWAVGSWRLRYPVDPIASDLWADNPSGMAAFSGRGPTTDGRIKPDLVAPGTSILSAHSRDASVGNFWGTSTDTLYCYMGGTSMATPLVAGCAAVVREYLVKLRRIKNPSAALIKAMLINGAVELEGQYVPSEAGPVPNFSEGFGCVNLKRTLSLEDPNQLTMYDENRELDAMEESKFKLNVSNNGANLKATLVWTDPPGEALQNDLDLIIRKDDGSERHGNMPKNNEDFDRTNNVEQVLWENISSGELEVIVRAYRIPMHPQSFALVLRIE